MRAAVAFLTAVGGAVAPDRGAAAWFGVVGAVVGAVVGGAWWAAAELWPPLAAAVLVVAVDAAITGLLHLDGLADSADGLLPPVERDRRLAIMATPDVGAFGSSVLLLTLAARVAALAALTPDPVLVAGLWAASRAGMAMTMATVPYARPRGTASSFAGGRRAAATLSAVAGLGAAGVSRGGAATAVVPVTAVAAFVAVVALARRRLGGYTGDVLGAAGVLAETAGLLAAAARW